MKCLFCFLKKQMISPEITRGKYDREQSTFSLFKGAHSVLKACLSVQDHSEKKCKSNGNCKLKKTKQNKTLSSSPSADLQKLEYTRSTFLGMQGREKNVATWFILLWLCWALHQGLRCAEHVLCSQPRPHEHLYF